MITVVMAIALLALVVAGGVNYMHPDLGVRTRMTEQIVTDYRVIESAIATYRIANRGARPTPSSLDATPPSETWKAELEDFLPAGATLDRQGFRWAYLADETGKRSLCLESPAAASHVLHDAATAAVSKLEEGRATIAADCAGTAYSSSAGDAFAIVFKLN